MDRAKQKQGRRGGARGLQRRCLSCSELRLDHTTSLICSTPKLVPFPLRGTEQRTSASPAKGWSHLINKCGVQAYRKSQIRHRLCNAAPSYLQECTSLDTLHPSLKGERPAKWPLLQQRASHDLGESKRANLEGRLGGLVGPCAHICRVAVLLHAHTFGPIQSTSQGDGRTSLDGTSLFTGFESEDLFDERALSLFPALRFLLSDTFRRTVDILSGSNTVKCYARSLVLYDT
jgi:hypothetical protein